jgi:hypothetical protein
VDYERRIKSLEYLLQERSEAQPQFQQQPLQPADDSISLDTWVSNLRTQVDTFPAPAADVDPESYNDRLGEIEEEPLSAQTTNMTSTTNGIEDIHLQELEDFEPSTDFQLEAALLQDPSFQSDPITAKDCSSYLPPPELGVSLLTEFLVDFNTVYPIYRPYAIAEHLRICYEGRSDGSALAWASAYVVFGLAHRVRGMSLSTTPEDDQMADWYLYSILPTVSGLLAATPGFGLVQCLLGLALLIRSSRNHKPYALYISTALRIAQCFAYKSQENIDVRVDQDVEQERRVFWIAFILDTDQSMFSSVPTTPRRADINASLPDDDPQDKLGFITAAEGNLKVNFFCLRIELVLLESEAIEQILSTKAPKRTPPKTISAIQELLQRFQRWRDNDLFRRTPEELLQLLYRADLLHTLSVEASYFATVFRLHSFLLLKLDPNLNPFSTNILAKLAAQKTHASYKDAEHFLGLISMTPHRQIGICWYGQPPLIFTNCAKHMKSY